MPKARKYSDPKQIVKSGYRRVSKAELKALGYSSRSALYTRAGVNNPTKFLTRSDIAKYIQPARDAELKKQFHFPQIKHERIRAARRKIFRHLHTVYSNYQQPVTLEQAIQLTENFLDYLERKYHPTWRNAIGLIYKGIDDDFSIQPRIWRDRQRGVIDELKAMVKKYKAKMKIIFILGWIEQSK